MIAFLHKLVRR